MVFGVDLGGVPSFMVVGLNPAMNIDVDLGVIFLTMVSIICLFWIWSLWY